VGRAIIVLDRPSLSITATFPYFLLCVATHKKKNWLFIGHPDAGQRSAVIYSIVVSCQRRGIDPLTYLRDVLTRLPQMTTKDDLDAITPARWQPAA
jgi:hypothetical protein